MLLIYFLINFVINPTKIYLNLDKPNDKIIHMAVTLRNNLEKNISGMFPGIYRKLFSYKRLSKELQFLYTKELYW